MVFAVDPPLAFRDFQVLKLKYDKLLSNVAINCNMRPYVLDTIRADLLRDPEHLRKVGRCRLTPGLHS